MTNIYKTTLEEEYYLVMPNKSHGKTVLGETLNYALASTITTYATEEAYIAALSAEGIPLNDEVDILETNVESTLEEAPVEKAPNLLQRTLNLFTSN